MNTIMQNIVKQREWGRAKNLIEINYIIDRMKQYKIRMDNIPRLNLYMELFIKDYFLLRSFLEKI